MAKQNRIFSMLMATSVALVLLFSVIFIADKIDHNCHGKDCPICQQISTCQNVLQSLALAGSATTFVMALFHIVYKEILPYVSNIKKITLVSLKVELLN